MLDLSPETEALARSLAETHNLSIDAAVRGALEAQSRARAKSGDLQLWAEDVATSRRQLKHKIATSAEARDMSPVAIAARLAASDKIVAEIKQLPIFDNRPIQEIVDDMNGL